MQRVVLRAAALMAALACAPAAGAWTWPSGGGVVQPFVFDPAHPYAGGQHRGIDVGGDAGESVLAPAGGIVSFAGSVPTSGRSVTIQTPDGLSVTLVHLGSIEVIHNEEVAEGEVVGIIGPSGTPEVADPYVHMGVRVTAQDQGYLDPLAYLPPRGNLPPPVSAGLEAEPAAVPSEPAAAPEAPAPAPEPERAVSTTTQAADPVFPVTQPEQTVVVPESPGLEPEPEAPTPEPEPEVSEPPASIAVPEPVAEPTAAPTTGTLPSEIETTPEPTPAEPVASDIASERTTGPVSEPLSDPVASTEAEPETNRPEAPAAANLVGDEWNRVSSWIATDAAGRADVRAATKPESVPAHSVVTQAEGGQRGSAIRPFVHPMRRPVHGSARLGMGDRSSATRLVTAEDVHGREVGRRTEEAGSRPALFLPGVVLALTLLFLAGGGLLFARWRKSPLAPRPSRRLELEEPVEQPAEEANVDSTAVLLRWTHVQPAPVATGANPRRRRVAVCGRPPSSRACGLVRPGGRLRPLSPLARKRRADGVRNGRARHAGDGRRRQGARVTA